MHVHVCTYVHRTCIRVLKFIHNYVLVHVQPHVIPPSDVLWAHNWEFDAIKLHGAHESHLKYCLLCHLMHTYTDGDDEISFDPDDIIENIEMVDEGWWIGEFQGKRGLFPSNYVELIQ